MADKIPTWVYPLVLADFETSRSYNNGEPPKKKRFFCTVCEGCDDDLDRHEGHSHRVLKALKSTNQYGVPTTVLSDFLDVSEVDTGSINGSSIHFLQTRRHVRGSDQSEATTSKSCDRRCYRCQWKLNNKRARFCSVECKYKPALLKKMASQVSESPPPPPLSMVVDQKEQSPSTSTMTSNMEAMESPPPSSTVVGEDSEFPLPSNMVAVEQRESASANPKKSRRKSLPRRAPSF